MLIIVAKLDGHVKYGNNSWFMRAASSTPCPMTQFNDTVSQVPCETGQVIAQLTGTCSATWDLQSFLT